MAEKFTYIIEAKDASSKIIKDISREVKNTNTDITKLSSSVTAISSSFLAVKGAAEIAIGATRAIISSIGTVVRAAQEQEDAINSVTQAMKISGDFTRANLKDYEDFASALQEVSTIGDEAALNALALARNLGATHEQAKELVKVAADVSQALDKDLDQTVINLAKTLNGSLGELGEVNGGLKNLSKEALESGQAIKILGEQFGGTASSKINTFSGALTQLQNTYGDFLESLGRFITMSGSTIDAIKSINKALKTITVGFDEGRKAVTRFTENAGFKLASYFEGLTSGKSFDQIKKELDSVAKIDKEIAVNAAKAERDLAVQNAKVINREKINIQKEFLKDTKKINDENAKKAIKDASDQAALEYQKRKDVSAGVALGFQGLQKGAEGVGTVVTGIASSLGPEGAAIGAALNFLAQDKEAIKEQIRAFAEAAPEFIERIVENVPVLIEELTEALPRLIESLAQKAPQLITVLAQNMPSVAVSFAKAMVQQAPAIIYSVVSGIGQGIIDGIKESLGFGGGGGIGGFIGDVVGTVGGFLGFAKGGEVPMGFPNDNFPARLSSGENVVDRSTNEKLNSFLDGGGTTDLLLSRVIELLQRPMQVESRVEFRQEALANIILNLNRTGARLTV